MIHETVNAGKEEWLTPPWLLERLGPFDLDPCAPVNPPWKIAEQHYTIFDNGLNKDWHGLVWLNPPYGRKCEAWLKKLADHGNGFALVPARTETAWFGVLWANANTILFLSERIKFHHANGSRANCTNGIANALAAFGAGAASKLADAKLDGWMATNWARMAS